MRKAREVFFHEDPARDIYTITGETANTLYPVPMGIAQLRPLALKINAAIMRADARERERRERQPC